MALFSLFNKNVQIREVQNWHNEGPESKEIVWPLKIPFAAAGEKRIIKRPRTGSQKGMLSFLLRCHLLDRLMSLGWPTFPLSILPSQQSYGITWTARPRIV